MEYKRFGNTIVARLVMGEEICEQVKEIALKENIKLAQINALGAVSDFTVGVYNVEDKKYYANSFKGAYEIVSFHGNITTMNGEYYGHLHIACGDDKGQVFGGHLNNAIVGPTCEMFIDVYEGTVDRVKDESIGINILKF